MTGVQNDLPPKVQMVDLFAGPGGLDVAARWLGVTAVGVEWDPNACATRLEADLATDVGDVRDRRPQQFPGATVLTGGPPCQTYTVAGNGDGRRALNLVVRAARGMAAGDDAEKVLTTVDERTRLVLEPLRWVLQAHRSGAPFEAVVLEQVPAVLPVWRTVREVLRSIGYSCECEILRTEEFGVPQTRRRAILVARRNARAALPAPTHRQFRQGVSRDDGDPTLLPWRTMGEALDRSGPFTVISNYGTGGDPKKRGRRSSDQPSATVTGKVRRNRVEMENGKGDRFTFAEAGVLQTFPSDYPWSGRDIAQQIGNAIPPRLAVHVLASALGRRIDEKSLDDAMTRTWADAKAESPLVRSTACDVAVASLFDESSQTTGLRVS
ncbi:DNA cytosine methyltransferase [Kribbella sp. NPDC050820]|uniref:DNA cytosine methyltransferase n=1 Tax=Kribbella sp. NPDC050820 TaxID=3155408 RepID=UPI0033F3AD4B